VGEWLFTPLEKGIRCSLLSSSVSHALRNLYKPKLPAEVFLDYSCHTQAPDAALCAIHMFTPHHTAKWYAYHMQQPTVRPSPALQDVVTRVLRGLHTLHTFFQRKG